MKQLKNFLIKREQSQACLSFAKREKSRLLAKTLLTLALLLTAVTGAYAAVPDKVYYRVYDYSDGKLTYTDNEIAGTGVTEVTNSTTEWADGTYVVTATTTISSRITVTGTVNLIILDGATLTAEKGITVSDDNTLNIYMGNSSNSIQSTGQLNATAVEDMDESAYPNVYDIRGAGIGGYIVLDPMEGSVITDKIECGNVNIHGGKINVQNESKRVAGIGGAEYGTGGNITIYYSQVTAYGNELVSAIGAGKNGSGGTVAIYGGNVNAIVTNIYNTTTPGIGASLTVGKDVQVYALSGSKSPDEDLSDDTNVAPEGGGQVTTFNNSMFTRYTGSAAASSASSGPEVAWNKAEKTGSFTMPGGNVTLEPEYYPQAALTVAPMAINDVPATTDGAIVKAGTVADIGLTVTAQGTVMYYVSQTALDDDALLALTADQWTADVPTAAHLAQGQAYIYYYVRGNDSDNDEENFSDGDILAANALTVTIAAVPTKVTLAVNDNAMGTVEVAGQSKVEWTADTWKGWTENIKEYTVDDITMTSSQTARIREYISEDKYNNSLFFFVRKMYDDAVTFSTTGDPFSRIEFTMIGDYSQYNPDIIPNDNWTFEGKSAVWEGEATKSLTLQSCSTSVSKITFFKGAIPDGVTINGDGTFTVAKTATVTLKATPAEGYKFLYWEDDQTNTNPVRKVTIESGMADMTYKAVFAEILYNVTFVEGTNLNEWTATPNTDVKKGTEVTVTYTGTKKVIGVKAEKKAAEPVADIIWDVTNVSDLSVAGTESYEKEGVTLRANVHMIQAQWYNYGDPTTAGIGFNVNEPGGFTFTAPTGKAFTKIEMTLNGSGEWETANLGTGWAFNADMEKQIFTVTWTGSAASTVDLLKDTDDFSGPNVKSIAFYLSE